MIRFIAWAAILGGVLIGAVGFALGRDWLLLNRDAFRFGLGIAAPLKALFIDVFGMSPEHDVVELLLAVAAVSAIAFGSGILLGRASVS